MSPLANRLAAAAASVFVVAALLALPPAASAQQDTTPTPSQAAPPSSPGMAAPAPKARADRVETRIKRLHDQLKITAAQEPKWTEVAQIMRDSARSIDELAKKRAAERASMTATDDLRSYEAIADAHSQELKQLVPAFSALYDTMSDTQKKNADQVFAQRPRPRAHAASKG